MSMELYILFKKKKGFLVDSVLMSTTLFVTLFPLKKAHKRKFSFYSP